MLVLMNTGGIAATNCYLIADEIAKQAVLFDAPDHTTLPLLDEASKRGWDITGLWLTHGHFDHFADHALVKKRFPHARVLIHELDAHKVQNPNHDLCLFGLSFLIPPLNPDGLVTDNQILKV